MTLPPEDQQVAAGLVLRQYRPFQVASIDRHEAAWYRDSGVTRTDDEGSIKRGQICVRRYRLDAPQGTFYSYQVGSIFETPLGSLQAFFYSLRGDQLLGRLPDLEAEVVALQTRLFGEESREST